MPSSRDASVAGPRPPSEYPHATSARLGDRHLRGSAAVAALETRPSGPWPAPGGPACLAPPTTWTDARRMQGPPPRSERGAPPALPFRAVTSEDTSSILSRTGAWTGGTALPAALRSPTRVSPPPQHACTKPTVLPLGPRPRPSPRVTTAHPRAAWATRPGDRARKPLRARAPSAAGPPGTGTRSSNSTACRR